MIYPVTNRLTDVPDGTVLYDGECMLCSAWFRFFAARESSGALSFHTDPGGIRTIVGGSSRQ